MINDGALLKSEVNAFLERNSQNWIVPDRVLYDLAAKYPEHKDEHEIVAKIWIIGRSYAAALERRKNKTEDDLDRDFYYDTAAPAMLKTGPELDRRIARLNRLPGIAWDNLDFVLDTHKYLMDVFYEIAGLEKRSLASKYLHFHCPSMFFIYDSRANNRARPLVRLDSRLAKRYRSPLHDKEYTDFCIRMLELRQFCQDTFHQPFSPRRLDSFLLGR